MEITVESVNSKNTKTEHKVQINNIKSIKIENNGVYVSLLGDPYNETQATFKISFKQADALLKALMLTKR